MLDEAIFHLPDEETKQRLKAEHPRACLLVAGNAEFIIRPPTRGEFRKFRELSLDERRRAQSLELLARDCVLYPAREVFAEILEQRPALGETIANRLLELAGAAEETEVKPL